MKVFLIQYLTSIGWLVDLISVYAANHSLDVGVELNDPSCYLRHMRQVSTANRIMRDTGLLLNEITQLWTLQCSYGAIS